MPMNLVRLAMGEADKVLCRLGETARAYDGLLGNAPEGERGMIEREAESERGRLLAKLHRALDHVALCVERLR